MPGAVYSTYLYTLLATTIPMHNIAGMYNSVAMYTIMVLYT